jgi:hypothetical protein
VTGIVADAASQQPLGQFTVSIAGQSINVSPAAHGQYTVGNIPVGTQSLTVYAVGYNTYVLPGIVVQKDQTTPIPPIGLTSTTGL